MGFGRVFNGFNLDGLLVIWQVPVAQHLRMELLDLEFSDTDLEIVDHRVVSDSDRKGPEHLNQAERGDGGEGKPGDVRK